MSVFPLVEPYLEIPRLKMGRVEKFRDRCEVFHVGTSCSRALYVWTTDQNWSHCHSDLKAAYWTALQVLRMLSRAGQAIRMGQYFETCPTLALESLISGRQAFAISFSQRRVSLLQLAHLSHRSQLRSMMVWRSLFHNGLRSPGRSAVADKS